MLSVWMLGGLGSWGLSEKPIDMPLEPYPFEKINSLSFRYTRGDGVVYFVDFEESHSKFKEACTTCSQMWEVNWFDLKGGKPCLDARSARTLISILQHFLNEDLERAILYQAFQDGREEVRLRRFERIFQSANDPSLEKICNEEFVNDSRIQLCLIVKRESPMYGRNIRDLNYYCKACEATAPDGPLPDFLDHEEC